MRFIHTADWHLGRLFHGGHLTDDQAFTLEGLLQLVQSEKADAVVIAGDVFDRAVPPPAAVELLDGVIARLALELGVAVVMIAGNHDSATRLQYFSELARRSGVHVVGSVGRQVRAAEVRGADGTLVRFWGLAYTDPETARFEMQRDDLHTHEQVIAAQLETIGLARMGTAGRADGTGGAISDECAGRVGRDVIVCHAFVLGCQTSDSERELTVGGSAAVSASLFDGFDYVALGHLHGRQNAASERVRYSGSLLKYSFSETDQQKSVSIVDLDENGGISVREATLPIKHDVRRVRGTFAELASRDVESSLAASYVEAILTDAGPVLNAADGLREKYPYLVSLRREEAEREMQGPAAGSSGIVSRSTAELFADFFLDVKGTPVSDGQAAEIAALLNELERTGREAGMGGPEKGAAGPAAGRISEVAQEGPAASVTQGAPGGAAATAAGPSAPSLAPAAGQASKPVRSAAGTQETLPL